VDLVYPEGPAAVPDKLTAASRAYRLNAWLALAGLSLFMAVYCALAGWFGWTAYRLFAGAANAREDAFPLLLAGAGAAFLAVFMLKALVFMKRGEGSEGLEITAADEPTLFAFLHRLADETGAPRPHRVYLSAQVNACVSYDLSIANLLLPSRKNLEIGLGLVNVLSLGELKAVLAHEFGHFAQRTMAVGRWVYIAQQIAGHIVARRDAFDTFLGKLSRVDLRIAWIGWLLRLLVWSIRCLLDFFFRIVVLAQRALGREMELQADLVAVSVTGSDALIHALYRLGAADQAWDRAVDFASGELREGRGVQDLFALQTRIIDKLRTVLGDPAYGVAPPVPVARPESHRLFKAAIATQPRMWSTHPTNVDREANAKRAYVAAAIDERSAWTLFTDSQAVRERISAHLLRSAEHKVIPIEESLARLDKEYTHAYLDPRYRGVYLGRSIVRHAGAIEELYEPLPAREQLAAALGKLYPESLASQVERLRSLQEEHELLTALRAGFLTAPGGVILHRGEEISRKALPRVIAAVQQESDACAKLIRDDDRRCRSVHLAAAYALGEDWAAYLKGLLQTLHYADHVEANLLDARELLSSTLVTVTARGRVGSRERERILHSADTAYAALRDVHQAAPQVILDRTILRRLDKPSWGEFLEELRLPAPTAQNLAQWLNAVDSWMRSTGMSLAALRLSALEQLLLAEAQIARLARAGIKPGAAPPAAQVPKEYRLLLPGTERPRNQMSWWDRFQTASGVLPMIARMTAAAAIVGLALLASTNLGTSSVYVFNGLGRPVLVHLKDQTLLVPIFSHRTLNVGNASHIHVSAATADGHPIEAFEADLGGPAARQVYNIASAGALISWQAAYGSAKPRPPQLLGAPRWSAARADIVFENPPASVKTDSGRATRDVLTGLAREQPGAVLSALPDSGARKAVIATHARWDSPSSRYVELWMGYAAASVASLGDIVRQRLQDDPTDTFNLRLEQQFASGAQHETVCARQRQMAAASANNADLQYLAALCIDNRAERARAYIALHERWPGNPWLALGAGYALAGEARWQDALPLIDAARLNLPGLAEELTVESARIRRALAGPELADLAALGDHAELLHALRAAESPDGSETGIQHAYALLARGELTDTLAAATGGSDADRARVLRLVAASDGAQASQIQQSFELPPELGLDADTVLPTLAMAARSGHPLKPFKQAAAKILGPDAQPVLEAFALLQEGAPREQFEQALRGLGPEQRGHLYVAAAILGGAACPPDWRAASRSLLFATERPYLR